MLVSAIRWLNEQLGHEALTAAFRAHTHAPDVYHKHFMVEPRITVEQGIVEVRDALQVGLIKDATDSRYRNAQFIVQ